MQRNSETQEDFRNSVLRRNRVEVEKNGGKTMHQLHGFGYDLSAADQTIAAMRNDLTAAHLAQTKQ